MNTIGAFLNLICAILTVFGVALDSGWLIIPLWVFAVISFLFNEDQPDRYFGDFLLTYLVIYLTLK